MEELQSDSIFLSPAATENNANINGWARSVNALYRNKLAEANKIISSKLAKPIGFNENHFADPYSFRYAGFCKNKVELTNRWQQWLMQEVLINMYEMAQASGETIINTKLLLSFEPVARDKVKNEELKKIERSLKSSKNIEMDIYESYIKSIAKIFDPHSDYFSEKEKEAFEVHLSPTEPSFGFKVSDNAWGEVAVTRVIPGSPAWNSNEIHNGDILLQIRKPNGNLIDISEFGENPSTVLESWSENQIELKFKKADGKITIVKLFKEKIESTENRVQGFVLNGAKKIGYVSLPSFYREWGEENDSNEGCANDLAKEIIKLKKEGIAGLILDLRFNGGGSIVEAMEIVGIFIDSGPVAVVKIKDQPAATLKDMNRGSVYDGPLVVMINGASASASEFVAAALQDYNRALIVGTPTYGKGTGQKIFPMGEKNDEFLKITTMKLYRITGKTNQGKGVLPDIDIPDLTDEYVLKEKLKKHSVQEDSIAKKVYYTPALKIDLEKIRVASKKRVEQNLHFLRLDSVRTFYRNPIPLNIESYLKYLSRADQMAKSMNANNPSLNYKVAANQFDNSLLKMDAYRKSISDEAKSQIMKSPYIDEAFSIITDYINQTKK
jgi:carboxyl-terminal processing protease